MKDNELVIENMGDHLLVYPGDLTIDDIRAAPGVTHVDEPPYEDGPYTVFFEDGFRHDVTDHIRLRNTECAAQKIPVIKLTHDQRSIYVDTAKAAGEQLWEIFLGDGEEWRDCVGDKITVEIVKMDKAEFENLPEFEGF